MVGVNKTQFSIDIQSLHEKSTIVLVGNAAHQAEFKQLFSEEDIAKRKETFLGIWTDLIDFLHEILPVSCNLPKHIV